MLCKMDVDGSHWSSPFVTPHPPPALPICPPYMPPLPGLGEILLAWQTQSAPIQGWVGGGSSAALGD